MNRLFVADSVAFLSREIVMNKMYYYSLFSLLVVAGCGKKTEKTVLKEMNNKTTAVQHKEIPEYPSEREEMTDDTYAIEDFDFEGLDDEKEPAELARNTSKKASATQDAELDELLLAEAQGAEASEFGFKRVQFDFNKNDIRKDQKTTVREDVKLAKQAVAEGKEVVVQGHTCQIGSAGYNLALSQRRAEAVKKEMVKNGVPGEAVKTVGYGYESPLVWSDKTDRAEKIKELAANRRAEVVAVN